MAAPTRETERTKLVLDPLTAKTAKKLCSLRIHLEYFVGHFKISIFQFRPTLVELWHPSISIDGNTVTQVRAQINFSG